MGFDVGPCGPVYEDYEAAYALYSAAFTAAKNARNDAIVLSGISVAACLLSAGTVPCVMSAAAALAADGRAIRAVNARNESILAERAAYKIYLTCINNHKHYYGE